MQESRDYTVFIYFAVGWLVLTVILFLIYQFTSKRRTLKINKSDTINKNGRNSLYFLYRFFRICPGIKKVFKRVLDNTESVYPADVMSVNREATKVMLKATGFSIVIGIATVFLSNGDFYYICMGIMASLVIFHNNIAVAFNKRENQLLVQMKDFLAAVRHHYLDNAIVEDAIEDSLDEIPYEIGLHIAKIHEIITSPMVEEKTEEYTSTLSNRFLKLLLSICTSTKEYSNGEKSFLDSLSYLKEEINAEILKKEEIRFRFRSLSGIAIAPVFFLKPVETWVKFNMPDAAGFYESMAGKVMMVMIMLIAFASYYMVEVLKESKRGEIVTSNIWLRIASLPKISTLLNKIINKNYTKMLRVNEDMKEIGDQTGPKALLAKQCVFAIATVLLINSSVFVTTVTDKLTMLNRYVAEIDDSIVPNERYRQVMEETSKEYVLKYKDEKNLSKEALAEEIRSSGAVKNEAYSNMVADEVYSTLQDYKNTYYKWYTLLISLLAGIIAFYVPKLYLTFRCKIAGMSKEEEISQFQTLILVLMNADGMLLETILEWMSQFAYSFKASIDECIYMLESGEKRALEEMQMKEENKSFKRFVDCLLAIDETDIKTAFAEVVIDRDFALKEREANNARDAQKKASVATPIAFMPFILTLVGYLLGPMIILAIKMFMEMNFAV